MKFTKGFLNGLKDGNFQYSEDIDFSKETFSKQLNLNSLKDVHVEASAKYDSYLECLMLDLNISGTMVIPCARTLELVDYKFNDNLQLKYSFVDEDEETIYVSGNEIDTYEDIYSFIITIVPLRVFKEGTKPIIDESNDKVVDQRLAKLKELFDKED